MQPPDPVAWFFDLMIMFTGIAYFFLVLTGLELVPVTVHRIDDPDYFGHKFLCFLKFFFDAILVLAKFKNASGGFLNF